MGLFDGLLRRGPKIDDSVKGLLTRPLIVVDMSGNQVAPTDPDELKAWLHSAAERAAEVKSTQIFQYEEAGLVLIPAFTESKHVTHWLKRQNRDRAAITAAATMSLKPGVLFRRLDGAPLEYVRVIVDPGMPHERILKAEEMRWLVDQGLC